MGSGKKSPARRRRGQATGENSAGAEGGAGFRVEAESRNEMRIAGPNGPYRVDVQPQMQPNSDGPYGTLDIWAEKGGAIGLPHRTDLCGV
jgi:hypothetical protein